MNWLNTIDNFIGGDGGVDDDHTTSTGNGMDHSVPWSDDDDDDDDSEENVQLSFMVDNSNREDNAADGAVEKDGEDAQQSKNGGANERRQPSPHPAARQHQRKKEAPFAGHVRPGNIRRTINRQISSSSEEESSDEEKSTNLQEQKVVNTPKNPLPISLSGQNSLLKKPKLETKARGTSNTLPGRPKQSTMPAVKAQGKQNAVPGKPKRIIQAAKPNLPGKPKQISQTTKNPPASSPQSLSDVKPAPSSIPGRPKPTSQTPVISPPTSSLPTNAPSKPNNSFPGRPKQIPLGAEKPAALSPPQAKQKPTVVRQNASPKPTKKAVSPAIKSSQSPPEPKRKINVMRVTTTKANNTTKEKANQPHQRQQQSEETKLPTASKSLSPQMPPPPLPPPSAAVENDYHLRQKQKQQERLKSPGTARQKNITKEHPRRQVNDQRRGSATNDSTDGHVKSLATEIEELKALVEAVNAEDATKDTSKHAPKSDAAIKQSASGNDHAVQDILASRKPQTTDSVPPARQPMADTSLKATDLTEPFRDPTPASNRYDDDLRMMATIPQNNFSVSPGERKLPDDGDPSRVPQSEATLPVNNTAQSVPSKNSTIVQRPIDPNHISEASLDLAGMGASITINAPPSQESTERKSAGLSVKSSSSDLQRKAVPFEADGVWSSWAEDLTITGALAPVINCYGAFHVRLLRAQRLPCPVGSTVQAIVSLEPWKGRSRTEQSKTFVLDQDSSTVDHGVCATWDDTENGATSKIISLVHAYESELTPIPTVKIHLMLRAMKLMEFSMCSLTLPCTALMRRPGTWSRQWFLAEMQDAKGSDDSNYFGENQTTMVELEAVFERDEQAFGSSFLSIGQHHQTEDEEEEEEEEEEDTGAGEGAPNENSVRFIDARAEIASFHEGASVKADDDSTVVSKKPHLLRYKKFWKPASCAQCSTSLLGWRKTSFRCEACGLDSCSDCRGHLDIQIPCGSAKAIEIVGKAIQNKLTVSKFLEVMAPVDETFEQKKREVDTGTFDGDSSLADTRAETLTTLRAERTRIGVLRMSVATACVFREPLPSITEPEEVQNSKAELRPGDYYVRVWRTGTEGSSRTRTLASRGQLQFEDSSEMRLDVAYYGVEFFIEIVDALTDKPVGTSVLTTHGIIQQQRDLMIEQGKMSILNIGKKPPVFKGRRRMVLDLRAGVKSGVSSDFFVPADEKADKGAISGWVEINVGLEEDVKRLYGPSPSECPATPPDSLNLSSLNLHISRISDIVEDLIGLFGLYSYMVSWKNPLLTGFSFLAFLSLTITFNAEYIGCLPFFFIMVWMLSSAFARTNGCTKKRFVEEEADEWRSAEREIDVNYSLHRPVGRIVVSVSKGRNIRSRELGLAGNVGCRVFWDPLRYASETQKEKILGVDKSAKTLHEVGATESKYTTNPDWEIFKQSDECRRLKQVLPHHGHFFETDEEIAQDTGCEFPVLQPFRKVDDDDDETTHHFNAVLERWEASTGAVIFQIRFRDILNMLPGSDHVFGEVVLPLSALLEKGEMSGWFQILDVGTTMFAPVNEIATVGQIGYKEKDASISGVEDSALSLASDIPKIWLTVKWIPPEENLDSIEARETHREASAVIQEELLRWEAINRNKDKLKQMVVGGSIGAFQTVSGFAGTLQVIQNFLGKLVGTIEALRNLLNFTDPFKSSMILVVVSLLWLVLSLVPTRLLILVAGLAQYGVTAKNKIEKFLKDTSVSDNDDDASQASGLDDDKDTDAPIIWLKNAFRGLPTDEDLRKAYFWEGRRNGAKTRESYASEKRLARLKRLWRAQWHATLKIRGDSQSKSPQGACNWEKIFAVVQGHRFLWWKTVEDFDNGRPPLGRLFLAGHAGLSGLSPLEMREIDPKEVPYVVGIFGKGLQDQQRITLLTPNSELKDSLENSVIDASMKDE